MPGPKPTRPTEAKPKPALPCMVVLLRTLPDGSSHFLWMIQGRARIPASPSPDDRCLITFRTNVRPDEAPFTNTDGQFEAERLADQRRAYIDFEGPLSRNRGSVQRLAIGTVDALADEPNRFRLRGFFLPDGFTIVYEGWAEGNQWTFVSGVAEEEW